MDGINRDSSGNQIFELECLAILMAMKLWRTRLCGRHAIIFTDNTRALGSMVNGYAENAIGSSIVQVTHAILHTMDCVAWFERVSSGSNCADPHPGKTSFRRPRPHALLAAFSARKATTPADDAPQTWPWLHCCHQHIFKTPPA